MNLTFLKSQQKNQWALAVNILLALLAIAGTMIFPSPGSGGLDNSWQLVLAHGFIHRLALGRDLIFTYGPLGLWENHAQLRELVGWQLTWQLLSRSAVIWLVFLWIAEAAFAVQVAIWGALFLLATRDGSVPSTDAFYMVALWVAGATLLRDARFTFGRTGVALAVLIAFALVKSTLTAGSVAVVIIAAASHASEGRYRFGAGLLLIFGIGWLLGWIGAGQSLYNLPRFINGAREIVSGYTDAMMIPMRRRHLAGCLAIAVVLLGLACSLVGPRRAGPSRLALAALTMCLLALTWRHATSRADIEHLSILFFWGVEVAMLSIADPAGDTAARFSYHRPFWHVAIALTTLGAFAWCFRGEYIPVRKIADLEANLKSAFRTISDAGKTSPEWAVAENRLRTDLALPAIRGRVGTAVVDVHGFSQSHAIMGQYNYTPRPVPQTYSVYTSTLAARNEQWLINTAPQFVLLRIESIDQRLPSLDDAPALTWILGHYTLSLEEKGFLLLTAGNSAKMPFLSKPPTRLPITLGIWCTTPEEHAGEMTYVKLEPAFTVLGRLMRACLPVRPLELQVRLSTGEIETYDLPLSMASIGFSTHPFIRSNRDVVSWLSTQAGPSAAALRILAPAGSAAYYNSSGFAIFSSRVPASPSGTSPALRSSPGSDLD